ncbi:hypoxanthine phosphoribosyltransferase [Sphingomonas vulcanisoli]|uniref:Hypoxanthine phosphoribosyltransferase n=1 Tax=Sphingomonas vulcanisoli TaxID=1658060 RepID=A0ABX0TVS5_9SPHN|nr:phosphoribosyltransferase family protein [Sphingomonas vulcanisoli]NIJ07691.1 hypoxanthine phosphoribosyltransferase [Sphingomonas vulcanisoli]
MSQPTLVTVPHDQFVADVQVVAAAIEASGWRPDHIVGIGRGGLVPGAYLSHRTGISLLSVDHSSGLPGFADDLLANIAQQTRAGTHILLIDDINDSGMTINALRAKILAAGGEEGNLRVAVLIDNSRSPARVDYRARTIDRAEDKSWFVFPWEAMAPTATLIDEAGEVPERLGLSQA